MMRLLAAGAVPRLLKDGALTGRTTRRVPVLTPAQISQLPHWHVLVIEGGMAPAIGTVALMWNNRSVRRAERHAAWAARKAIWAADAALTRTFLVEVFGPRLAGWRERTGDLAARLDEQGRTGFDASARNLRAHRAARRDRRNG